MADEEHLYRNGAERRERRRFEAEYGKRRGDYVYGSVVGKVKREQDEERRRNEADHREAEARADRFDHYDHAHPHSNPSHHVGTCDEACRLGMKPHSHKVYRMNVPPRGTNR